MAEGDKDASAPREPDGQPAGEARRPRTTGLVERPGVWLNLDRKRHVYLIMTAFLGLILCAALVPQPDLGLALTGTGAGAAALACLALLARSWMTLRSWRARLPFPIEGWPDLVDRDLFWVAEYWCHLTVTVETDAAGAPAVQAALGHLVSAAQATYYAPDPTDEERVPWSVDGARARGSANQDTARVVALFCLKELVPQARRGSTIKRVTLDVAPKSFFINRPAAR